MYYNAADILSGVQPIRTIYRAHACGCLWCDFPPFLLLLTFVRTEVCSSFNMSQHRPPWDTYSQELISLGHGLPMWRPEPDTRYGSVSLGDVGYMCEGHFRFLFNSMLPADHSLNSIRGVPPGFTMFSPPPGSDTSMPYVIGPRAHLHSRNVSMRAATASAAGQYVGRSCIC